jgi:hypothetical protein
VSKHTALLTAIYSVFTTSEWRDQYITAMPPNFQGQLETEGEYTRINILASKPKLEFGNANNISGSVMIDIFIPQGQGINRTHEIADILDSLIQTKWIDGVQFGASTLQQLGRDQANSGLHRALYSIPFTYYG